MTFRVVPRAMHAYIDREVVRVRRGARDWLRWLLRPAGVLVR
jgi:hypothetical protein